MADDVKTTSEQLSELLCDAREALVYSAADVDGPWSERAGAIIDRISVAIGHGLVDRGDQLRRQAEDMCVERTREREESES